MDRHPPPSTGCHLTIPGNQDETEVDKSRAHSRHEPIGHRVMPYELRPPAAERKRLGSGGLRHDSEIGVGHDRESS